ncbi:AAA family ATPase [Arthrobacter sp. GCM10027362]|uniref:AAA family ATPase n=1 Tax=Arthrobacter sp. GCM10027362 TaxID=3273379 RepID=UPI00363E3264
MPVLEPWAKDRNESARLRSQYHYLFCQVATAVTEVNESPMPWHEQMDILALAPNSARRMVEAFLSFHHSEHIGNFHRGMRTALSVLEADPLRVWVERYLHAYSHNEEGDISKPLDVTEVSAVVASLFYLMDRIDTKHYIAMCRSLGLDREAILAVAGSK